MTGRFRAAFVLLFSFLVSLAVPQPIALDIDSLDMLVADSSQIVRGSIVSFEQKQEVGSWITVKFKVEETLKGAVLPEVQFSFRSYDDDPTVGLWAKEKTELLAFLKESRHFHDRRLSQYRFAARSGQRRDSFIQLQGATDQVVYTAFKEPLTTRDEILKRTRASIQTTREGKYGAVLVTLSSDEIPANSEARKNPGPVRIRIPQFESSFMRGSRFGSGAEYDGRRILAGRGKTIYLWDAATGKVIQRFDGHAEQVRAVAFTQDGRGFFSGAGRWEGAGVSTDISIRQWRVGTPAAFQSFRSHTGDVGSLDTSPDGTHFLSQTFDQGRYRLWDMYAEEEVFIFRGTDPKFSLDGSMIVDISDRYSDDPDWIMAWDAKTLLPLCTIKITDAEEDFFTAEFSPYGNQLVVTSRAGVTIRSAESGEIVKKLDVKASVAKFTDDGLRVIAGSSELGVYDTDTGALIRTIKSPYTVQDFLSNKEGTRCLATLRDKGAVAAGAILWDLETGAELLRFNEPLERLIGLSGDGKTFFAFGPRAASGLETGRIYSMDTGKLVRTIELQK